MSDRPIGREFLLRGAGVTVLYILSAHDDGLTENRMRLTVPYTTLKQTVADLEQAGWIARSDGRWTLTPVGRNIALRLRDVGELMERTDLVNLFQ